MIVERTGNLFSSDCSALGHGVNTLGSMGAGVAVEFRRRWPLLYDAYRQECRSGCLQPRGIFVYQAPDRLIVNLATQRRVGRLLCLRPVPVPAPADNNGVHPGSGR